MTVYPKNNGFYWWQWRRGGGDWGEEVWVRVRGLNPSKSQIPGYTTDENYIYQLIYIYIEFILLQKQIREQAGRCANAPKIFDL